LVFLLGRLVSHPVRAANVLEGPAQFIRRDVLGAENIPESSALLVGHGEEQVLGGHVLVTQLLCLRIGLVEDLVHFPAEARLHAAAGLGGKPGDLPLDRFRYRRQVETSLLKQRPYHSFVLREQSRQEMGIVYHGIATRPGQFPSVSQGFLGLDGQSLWSNHRPLTRASVRRPSSSRR
jgi:hypothetical protein